jgi:hypothetical protein
VTAVKPAAAAARTGIVAPHPGECLLEDFHHLLYITTAPDQTGHDLYTKQNSI